MRLFQKCDEQGDTELKVFVTIAATTALRKGSILPRKYTDVFLEEKTPYIYVGKTKNGDPIKIPLAEIAVEGGN